MVLGGKSLWLRSVVFSSFFPLSIFEASFLFANFTMTFLCQWLDFRLWQASILTGSIPVLDSGNISQTLLSRALWEMLSGMPEISRHSLFEHCSFAQQFLSTLVSWQDNFVFMFSLTARSDSGLVPEQV